MWLREKERETSREHHCSRVDVSDECPLGAMFILHTLHSILYTQRERDGRAPLQQEDVSMVPSGRHVYTPYSILSTLVLKRGRQGTIAAGQESE